MIVDFSFPSKDVTGDAHSDEAIASVASSGVDGVVLVDETQPEIRGRLEKAGLRVFQAHLVGVQDALLWVLPPSSKALEDLDFADKTEPGKTVDSLVEQGCAVLLCNPYARELPGGSFRDHAVFVHGAHGVLSLLASAKMEENLLAQEFAIVRRLPAAGGTGKLNGKNSFGRFLTLACFEAEENDDFLESIRSGNFMAVETTAEGFSNLQASDSGGNRDAHRRDNRRDGRDRGRGPRRPRRGD
jgi:hypothetical protein